MDVTMNIRALRDAEAGAAERDGLAALKSQQSYVETASDAGMFGNVPNAAQAAEALRTAAQTLLQEVEHAGHTVENIRLSSMTAAEIGLDSDDAARQALAAARADAVRAFNTTMSDRLNPRPVPEFGE